MQSSGVDPEGARSHLNAPRQGRNSNSQGHTVNEYGQGSMARYLQTAVPHKLCSGKVSRSNNPLQTSKVWPVLDYGR